jgi:hypothetical protein
MELFDLYYFGNEKIVDEAHLKVKSIKIANQVCCIFAPYIHLTPKRL